MYNLTLTTSYFPLQRDAELREITVGWLLRGIAASHGQAVAMIDVDENGECGQQWTYAALLDEAERLALKLSTRFAPGEKVVVWAPNIPEWIFTQYACGLAGLVLVTANPSFQARELAYVLDQSGAVGLFMVSDFRGNPMAAIAEEATRDQPACARWSTWRTPPLFMPPDRVQRACRMFSRATQRRSNIPPAPPAFPRARC